MGITILPAEDDDMLAIFTLCSEAFQENEPAFSALFPRHNTSAGRKAGAERYLKDKLSDANGHHFKAVDEATGEVVGYAKWDVYQNRVPPEKLDFPSYSYWPNAEEAAHAEHLMAQVMGSRRAYIASQDGNVVHLATLAVHPAHQRKGIGGRLVAWGVEKADEMGVSAFLESSIYGRGLYEKHGFVFEEDVELPVPDKWADRPKGRYAWMVRTQRT